MSDAARTSAPSADDAMPAEAGPRTFLESLPAGGVAWASHLPLTFTRMREEPRSGLTIRVAPSAHHRARVFACVPYHKPISRCFPG